MPYKRQKAIRSNKKVSFTTYRPIWVKPNSGVRTYWIWILGLTWHIREQPYFAGFDKIALYRMGSASSSAAARTCLSPLSRFSIMPGV